MKRFTKAKLIAAGLAAVLAAASVLFPEASEFLKPIAMAIGTAFGG